MILGQSQLSGKSKARLRMPLRLLDGFLHLLRFWGNLMKVFGKDTILCEYEIILDIYRLMAEKSISRRQGGSFTSNRKIGFVF